MHIYFINIAQKITTKSEELNNYYFLFIKCEAIGIEV